MCSATCPSHVPSLSRSPNPPRRPSEHECSAMPGSISSRPSTKPGIVFDGQSSSAPRSTSSRIARVVGPVVRTAEHLRLDHLEVGRERTLVRGRLVLRPPAVRSRAGPAVAHSEASRSTPGASASSARAAQVEPGAVGQRVHHRARDHDRPVALGLVGVGLRRGSRRSPSRRPCRRPPSCGRHRRSRWCPRPGRCPSSDGDCAITASSRPNRPRCSKCWSTTTPSRTPSPAASCAMRCLGVSPRAAERHHVRRHRARAGGGPGEHGAAVVRPVDRVGEARAGDDRGQAELVPAREEDRGRVVQGARELGVLGLGPLLGPQAGHAARSRGPRRAPGSARWRRRRARRRSRSPRRGPRAPGEGREPRQDQLVPDLVLGAADQHDRAGAADGREASERASGSGTEVTVRGSVAPPCAGQRPRAVRRSGRRVSAPTERCARGRRAGAGSAGRGARRRRRCPRAPASTQSSNPCSATSSSPSSRSSVRSNATPSPRPMDPDRRGRVEPAGGLVRALQDLEWPSR